MASLWRKLVESGKQFLAGKEVVGEFGGNKFVRWKESSQGVAVERREIKWAGPHMLYSPDQIPSEWRMWLRKQRDAPPTPLEIEQSASAALAMQGRVAAIDERDAQARLRQAAQGVQATRPGSSGPDLARLLQQQHQQDQEQQQQAPTDTGMKSGVTSGRHA